MKRLLNVLIIVLSVFQAAAAQSDDITLMGSISPLFYLENDFSEKIITSESKELSAEVSDIAVDPEHIYVRLFITDVPESMKSGITDENRIYGSYLPVAEVVTAENEILTPSSASRYSFLEYNSRLIIGGLLVFDTDRTPDAFYLNFNQLPFDTKPLSEGFSKAVILSPGEGRTYSSHSTAAVSGNGLIFALSASAQTNELTMIQPSVHLERPDEVITKFGWISIRDAGSGNKFAVTRGNLYGFNLADDSIFSPSHSYVFTPVSDSSPIHITMENAYIRRSIGKPSAAVIDLSARTACSLLQDGDFDLTLTDLMIFEKEEKIRLYISSENTIISDISFSFPDISSLITPPVTCGIDPQSEKFACDIYFADAGLPESTLKLEINAIEYRKEGPWTIIWNPVPMETAEVRETSRGFSFPSVSGRRPSDGQELPEAVQKVLDALDTRSIELTAAEGWIHESFGIVYQFREDYIQDLITVDKADQYFTEYIYENWHHVNNSGQIDEILTVLREPGTNRILSAQQQNKNKLLDLVHALLVRTDNSPDPDYHCFEDFSEISGSAAVFSGEISCDPDDASVQCLVFSQSLSGVSGSSGSQTITFRIDPGSFLVTQEMIDYDLGALTMTKSTLILENTETLPDDLLELRGSVK